MLFRLSRKDITVKRRGRNGKATSEYSFGSRRDERDAPALLEFLRTSAELRGKVTQSSNERYNRGSPCTEATLLQLLSACSNVPGYSSETSLSFSDDPSELYGQLGRQTSDTFISGLGRNPYTQMPLCTSNMDADQIVSHLGHDTSLSNSSRTPIWSSGSLETDLLDAQSTSSRRIDKSAWPTRDSMPCRPGGLLPLSHSMAPMSHIMNGGGHVGRIPTSSRSRSCHQNRGSTSTSTLYHTKLTTSPYSTHTHPVIDDKERNGGTTARAGRAGNSSSVPRATPIIAKAISTHQFSVTSGGSNALIDVAEWGTSTLCRLIVAEMSSEPGVGRSAFESSLTRRLLARLKAAHVPLTGSLKDRDVVLLIIHASRMRCSLYILAVLDSLGILHAPIQVTRGGTRCTIYTGRKEDGL